MVSSQRLGLRMSRLAFGKLGWNSETFEVYRWRVEYPVTHAVAAMQLQPPVRA